MHIRPLRRGDAEQAFALRVAAPRRGAGPPRQRRHGHLDAVPQHTAPYRRWGWEHAGVHVRRRVATRNLLDVPPPANHVDLRPYTPADLTAVVAVHDVLMLTEPGGLVAGERWLRRAVQPDPDQPEIVMVAIRADRPVGLLLVSKTAPDDEHSRRTPAG